ncbi:uncharacterized protein BDV17DRAFT_286633 [Aspergillus undulatus]|uniref:uncharacterized protein n=1 Tax=Aspergillus undulatus TaxID=1810928 RepID=UPI003CCD8FF5
MPHLTQPTPTPRAEHIPSTSSIHHFDEEMNIFRHKIQAVLEKRDKLTRALELKDEQLRVSEEKNAIQTQRINDLTQELAQGKAAILEVTRELQARAARMPIHSSAGNIQ